MSIPTLSQRGETAPASPIRRLAPAAQAARDRGIVVHHLNIGQPDLPTPRQMVDAYRSYDEQVLAYAPSDGYLSYREKLAAYYSALARDNGGAEVGAEDIVVTVGGSEALLFALAAITDSRGRAAHSRAVLHELRRLCAHARRACAARDHASL